ncbi:MAG: flagellar hook-associated protein FlgK [Lacunisphaera sp.]|nr:flagellar hook-associated protein FlgK [Lacunisphaera sp.]
MSGLFSTLHASVQALNAQSRGLETAGKNLANVNNPHYARQRVLFGDRGTVMLPDGAQSLGLEALGIQQVRDALLDQQVLREVSLSATVSAEQKGYQRAQASLGESITSATAVSGAANAIGLGAALSDFFNAFQSFAASPTDAGERQTLLQQTAILTDDFNRTDTRLAQVQTDLDAQISGDVATVNGLLQDIAGLNAQIGRVETSNPGSAVDLRDQRQARLEELAAKVPIEVRPAPNGQVQVVMKDAANVDVLLVDRATVTGPVTFTGTGLTAGAPATALSFASGSIHGALAARDGAVQQLRSDLNRLARQLVTAVNAAYNPSATAGADFFQPAGTGAGTIQVSAGLTAAGLRAGSGAAGDNSIALAVAAVAHRAFSTAGGDILDGTLGGFYSGAVSNLGQALATANSHVDNQTGVEKLVRAQRDAVSGVSLDEEMADLVKYQRAFQASSRVFSVIDELLDNVVNRMGG